jgi:hypothetical protein
MSYFPHGSFIAAQQARERRRRDEEEEEEMTRYTTEDLEDNWEFKIVRSETGAFRKPEIFQTLLQEESIAGWELVEKLDNRRVRFKRRRESRRRDPSLPPGYDPYRTTYGSSTARSIVIVAIGITIALVTGLGVIGFGILGTSGSGPGFSFILPLIVILAFVALMVGVIAIRRGR